MDGTPPDVIAAAVAAMLRGDREALDRLRTDDYLERRPQSGELIRGRPRMRELEAADPAGPARIANVRRVAGLDELWTIEARAVYPDGTDWFTVTILELRGDRIAQSTAYACEPLEAPAWRAQHVVSIDPDRPPVPLRRAAELTNADVARINERYGRAMAGREWDELGRLRSSDWSGEWPQSGEGVPSHAADTAIHRAYPGYPQIQMPHHSAAAEGWVMSPLYMPVRVHGAGPLIVAEGSNLYGEGDRWFTVLLLETGDGRIRRETGYFARPTEPEAWRSQWVERFDPLAPR